MTKFFVYGSLMNEEVVDAVLQHRFAKTQGVLPDYTCLAVLNEQYPGIRPKVGDKVFGQILDGVSPQHIIGLDEYEGEYYARTPVSVITPDNQVQLCQTYVFKSEYYALLSSSPWSNDTFRKQHLKTFLQTL